MNKLPDGWTEYKLKDIMSISSKRYNPNKDTKNYKCIELEHIESETGILNGHTNSKDIHSVKNVFEKGEVLYGKLRPYLKKFYLAKFDGVCSSEIWVLKGKKVINDFLYYFIQQDNFNYIANVSIGMIMPRADWSYMSEISFNIPPLDEQKRIASALSKIDAYLENTIKLIEEKERFKRGIAKKLLTCKEGENIPEARFKGFEDEWKEYNLSKIGVSYNGLRNKKANSFVENCNAKYITYKSVYDKNKIDINRLGNVFIGKNENQNLVKYGDIFFTISSETPDEVAISSVLLDEVENTYLNSFCFGFRFDFNILLPEFARYYFRSDYIRKSTYRLAQGITRYNISKKKFLDIIIYLPSLEEQEKIGGYLSLLDAEIDNLKKQKELIKEMKRGAMQKLLSGEVRL